MPATIECLTDGKCFRSKREMNYHKTVEYLTFADKTDATWVKCPGDVNGNPLILDNLKNCKVYICDVSEQVLISDVEDSEIVIGACMSTVTMRNCKNCSFYVATHTLYMISCDNVKLKLFAKSNVALDHTTNLTLGYFNVPMPKSFESWTRANLYPFTTKEQRRFMEVDDRDKDMGKNWEMDGERGVEFDAVSKVPELAKFGAMSNPMTSRTLPIGQAVEARFEGAKYWYKGKISGIPHAFGSKYDVKYADGDSETGVTKDLIRVYTPCVKASFESPQSTTSHVLNHPVAAAWKAFRDFVGAEGAGAGWQEKTFEKMVSFKDKTQWLLKVVCVDDASCKVVVEASAKGTGSGQHATYAAIVELLPVTSSNKTFLQWSSSFAVGTSASDVADTRARELEIIATMAQGVTISDLLDAVALN